MKRVRLRALITPDHVRYILYAPMAILLPVALTAIFMISLLSCVMPLVKILLTLRHVCVGHQEGGRAKLLTTRNVSSILTVHQAHGDRSSIGRALDCGSSGCGFKPHRSPFYFSSKTTCAFTDSLSTADGTMLLIVGGQSLLPPSFPRPNIPSSH